MDIREVLKVLKKSVNEKMNLSQLIGAFEEICKIKIDVVEEDEDIFLFETSTYKFKDESSFQFSLVRQMPNEDEEYIQLHLVINYQSNEQNKLFKEAIWSEGIDENFFDFVRKSEAYLFLEDKQIEKVDIFIDET